MDTYSPITLARFWSKVHVKDPADCWTWKAHQNSQGYGWFNEKKAHRVAYEIFNGPIPRGQIVCHRCDTPSCCNPRHLFVGTHQDNSDDAKRKGRTVCGVRHPNAKLTAEQVAEIRSSPLTGEALARKFGVSKSTVSGVRNFKHRLAG